MTAAIEESKKRQHGHLGVEHLFVAFSRVEEPLFQDILFDLGVDPQIIMKQLDHYLASSVEYLGVGVHVTASTKNILRLAWKEAQHFGRKLIESRDLFVAFFQDGESVPARIFSELGVDSTRVIQTVTIKARLLAEEKEKYKKKLSFPHTSSISV